MFSKIKKMNELASASAQKAGAFLLCRKDAAIAREQGNGQSHMLEIVATILVVVAIAIFLYLTTVPEVKSLINGAMTQIGTIVPN